MIAFFNLLSVKLISLPRIIQTFNLSFMKTTIKSLAFFLILFVAFSACSKLDKVLVKKDGVWNIASQKTTSTDGNGTVLLDNTEANTGTLTFNDNGTGVTTDNNNQTEPFTWSYSDSNEQITITDDDGDTTIWDVLETSKKEQKFRTSATLLGITTVIELTLARVD